MQTHYTEPVKHLLTYGDCSKMQAQEWPEYCDELGLTQEHIPELIRMAADQELHSSDTDSLEIWAPLHAMRVLGQLHAQEAVKPLLTVLYTYGDDDWISEDLLTVFEMIGTQAVPELAKSIIENTEKTFPNMTIAEAIQRIGDTYQDAKHICIAALTNCLEHYSEQASELNAFLIGQLAHLRAVSSLPLIRQAFEQEYVDYSMEGDIEDIEIRMGIREKRSDPPDHPTPRDMIPGFGESLDNIFGRSVKRTKIGRNDPCPCGSGKKYKKCCLNHPDGQLRSEFLAMFSLKKITIREKQKELLIELLQQGRKDEAIRRVQELTDADQRLIADYIKRIGHLASAHAPV